jgi:autotransporter-associated beta strand protein
MKTLRRHKQIINLFLVTLMACWQIGQPLQANTLTEELAELSINPALITGATGLQMNGGGSIRLTNLLNDYTGITSLNNGSLIISDGAVLGTDTSAIRIRTNNTTPLNNNMIGFGGGSLVLDGTTTGFTLGRDINFEGRGPIGDRGAAIQSLGNNTLSGVLTSAVSPLPLSPTATIRNSRINSVNGTLTLSGTLNAGGTAGTVNAGTFTSLGGVNSAGVGNFSLTGVLAGTGSIEKSGAGTLFLNPSSTSGFSGTVRVGASSIGQQSTVRVTQATVGGTSIFGTNTAGNASGAIDMNGGVLEFRNEGNLDFNALASGKNVYLRANSTFYTGPAAGGEAINGVTTLGTFRVAANTTGTFNSRNGYGMTLQAWTQESSNNNTGIANNMGGTLTFTGDAWNNADADPRNLTFSGNGNTRIAGSIVATVGTGNGKQVIKQGTGELILNGTGGTFTGATIVEGGSLRITDFRSINNNAIAVRLGNAGTTAGNLIIGGTGTGTATGAGLTTSKPILFNSTTGQSAIYANQAFAAPVILNGAITSVTTTGNYNFGGSSTQDNIINVALPAGTTGGLTKVGAGTWVLNAANLYTGATTIQGGTLKLRATGAASNVIQDAGAIVFSAQATAQTAGGTLEFRGFSGAATTETLGALTPTAGAATVRLLGNGGSAANLTFTSLGATTAASSVNFETTGANGGVVTLTGAAAATATTLPGTANFQGHLYINGANFADAVAGVVTTPTYAAAGNFQNAGAALVAGVHNRLTAATANGAATISSLLTDNQTLSLSGNLIVSTGGILQSGGTASILSDSATSRLIQGGAAATNVAIRVNLDTDVLNLGNATNPVNISSTTTGGLTKNGAGTLVVFGTNAQTGTTTINEGKVSLNGAAARLSATTASLVVRQGATLELLTGVTAANAVVNAVDGAGTISGQSGQTFTQNGGGTWNGVFSGAGLNITKGGAAATWSGVSTYTGVTTIGGTGLVTVDTLANGGVNSGIGASTSDAANLVFTGSSAAGIDYRGNIIDTALTLGSRSASTDRLFTLAAAATGANLTSSASNSNAIVWSNTGAIVNNTTANAILTLAGASTGDNTLNPQLVDSSVGGGVTLGVTKSGAGQWNLGNASNTYTGLTTISEGILGLNKNGALPANSPLVLGAAATSGILQASGTLARTLSTTSTAGIGSITWGGTAGGGFAAHSTALSVTLDGGAGLTWGSGGFVPAGASLILNSGSSLADVTFTNAIDLGAAARTVTVNDNGQTGADYADLTGVLSGVGGSLVKAGTGILRLTGANSYTGNTTLTGGTLVVSSLGSSTGGATSGAGAGGVTMNDANAMILGNGGAQATGLVYVGAGEASDRKIRLNATGTNHVNAIYADGSGPLVLSNVANDMVAGTKTLSLRGTNTAGNMITSVLANNGTDALSVTIDGGATWILTNAANNYTGATTAGAGALGIGDNSALGTGTLTFNNGNVFAFGADRTLTNPITHNNNTNAGFFGDYSLTFSAALNLAAAANNANTTTNNIVAGKTLTFAGGVTANSLGANRAWAIDGAGETVINGAFTTTTPYGVRFDINGGGTLTLGTNGATSNFNQSILVADVDHGTLKFGANNALPTTFTAAAAPTTAGVAIGATTYTIGSTAGLLVGQTFTGTNVPAGSRIVSIDGPTTFTTNAAPTTAVASGATITFAGSGGVTLTPELATADMARIDLNGTNQAITAFTATTDGAVIIDNTSAAPATLTFGANNSTVSITNTGARTITDSGTGALSIVKAGNTALTLPTGMALTYQGATSSTGGGSFTINSALNGTSGLIATGSSTLALLGGLTNPGAVTSIEVGGGSTLSLLDGAGSLISNLTSLSLGNTGSGTVTLNLNIGDSATDTLTLLTGGTLNLGNTITFNMTDAGLSPGTTYTLLNLTSGGLSAFGLGNIIQGATPGGFTAPTWTVTDNVVQITTGTLITGASWWNAGGTLDNWNDVANWSITDKTGTIPAVSIPGQGTDVKFIADNITGGAAITTTLEQNFKVNSLTFEASTTPANTPVSVTINPGTINTSRLEVAPQLPTEGVAISAGGPAAVTISAPFRLGNHQTWTVADAASTLTLSGGLQGEKDVTKAGAGRVILSAAAGSSFNAGLTTDITVTAGNLELTNVGALGTVANSNLANVIVNGGGFYFNGAASTTPNPITLGGGSLSAGGGTQTYSGTVNVSSASTINMADSNGPNTNTARSITLSGVVSGNGNLTIDSNNTAASGNQLGGTLTMNNAANTWTGDLFLNRGTVTLAAAASPSFTSNDVTFNSFGRVILQSVNGATLNRTGALTVAPAAVGEFQVDNTSGTLTSNYTVNQNSALTLGAGSAARFFLADAASQLNLNAGVVLNGNASISVAGGDADSLVLIDTVGISDGGNNFALTINDDAGGWNQTNTRVQINVAGTHTGGTTLADGILILGNKNALGAGGFTVTGGTLQGSVDLSGANALTYATTLAGNLTVSGANNITFNSTVVQSGGNRTLTSSITGPSALLINQLNLAEAGAVAARNLTVAGAGLTTINTLVNNDQNNILTNNTTVNTLMIGTAAISDSAVVGRTLELGGTGSTTVTGLIEDVAGGAGLAGTLQKTGSGTLTLQGTNTFTGPVNVNGGILDYSTVTNIGGGPSNLGAGSLINLGGGTLRFIGSTNQTTDRPINASVNSTLNTSGTGSAEISYTGSVNMGAFQLTLTGASSTNIGNLSGGITQTGTAADIAVNSGTWNLTGTNTFSDDVIVTGTSAILNVNATGTLGYAAGTSNGLYSRDGALININAANASGIANSGGLDFIIIADTPTGATATVNMAPGSSIETPRLDVGSTINPGRTGNVTGTGLITVTSTATDYLSGIRLFDGSIAADLAGVASMLKQGTADFTLSGNNSGLTGTVAATRIDAGNLILDYTTQNNNKISAAAALDMRGGRLTLNGNNSAATTQSVASFTLANGGANTIAVNPGTGQTLVLNLGAITRAASVGTVRLQLPAGAQDATNGVTTTTAVNANGSLGGFLTVTDATGTYFATKSGNNIIPLAPTVASDASTWTNGQNITDTGTAFSGTTGLRTINSLSFNHATGGTVTVANTATLDLFNGGALVTSNVTSGAPTITGGRLTSTAADVIVTHDGSSLMTINSQIGLNNGVTKTGNGTLLINGAINNYTGATQIQAGTLQVSGGNAIGNASSVVLSDDRASTLELLANETIGNLSGGNAGTSQVFGTVALGSNTLNINSTGNATYAGVFTGSGSIVRNGSSGVGNLLFTGNSGAGFAGAIVANGGLMYVEGVTTMNASSLTINKGGSFLISNNGTTRSGTRFLDTMPIMLNSADGAWGTETRPSGLSIRTDQAATTNETVGVLSLASGASYFRGDASGTSGVAGLITSDIIRSSSSTINARGRALGATTGDRNFLRIASGTANETAFASALVGGAGAAGSKNISIVPWGIGEVTTAGLADANMGNSLLTYVVATGSGAGLRPLDLATEYNTFASKTADTDNLRESLAADLTGIAGQTINALVVNNSNTTAGTVNVTGTGATQTLAVTSGTMLFTATAAVTGTPAMGINLGGFDGGITVGSTNEYIFFVQNPTSAVAGGAVTATVSSPLTSTADITKSGRGMLILTTANTAGGGTKKTTLNEGILEIADLDNIGGNTGALVFAGGTLRLGSTLTDDISSRTISILNGGGTIDTNGVNLTLANSVGSGVGGLTKTGLGILTLGAASTYTGTTTVSGGSLAVTANNATGGGGPLAIGAGATLDIGTSSISHSTVTTTGASPIITGAGTITSSGGFNFTHTGDTTIDANLAGTGGLFKNQTNVLTLNGASTYTGGTEIQNGTIAVNVLSNAGTASSLGAPAAGSDASVIRLGLTTASTGITYVGATNSSTDRILAMQGTTGGVTLNGNGAGAVDYAGGAAGYSTGAKTLTLSGTSATSVVNRINGVADGIGAITLAKSGTNLWEVYGTSSYTGATQINDGTLQIGNDNALPVATAVRVGTGTTAGTFDLNGFNQTIGSLLVQTNSNTVTNNIVVDSGKTLTVNGAVTIGVNADNSDTNLTASGGGSIVVNSGGAGFQIGGATGTTNENRVDVDFSGLASFTANLGTGSFRLGDANSASGTSGLSTFKLATNNTITASDIRIGDGSGNTDTHLLTLGSGANVFNANTMNIGSAVATIRSGGSVIFDGADTTGQFTLRASDGTSRATLNMINTTGNTAGNMDAILNLAGHTADILASTLTLATRSTGTGAASATLAFDQGTLDITTLNMASRTGAGTGAGTAIVTLGDSAAVGTPTVTIGTINMAVNTSAGGAVTADLNVTGGTVNIGDGLNTGTAINMANAGTGRTVTSTIDLTGGTVNVTGDIVRTGGAGTESATITLDASILNMNSNSIGETGKTITLAAKSGTLTGLAELNGGGILDKTTAGVLIMGDGNAYTGGTTVTGGTLLVNNSTGSGTGTGAVTSNATTVLGGTGILAPGTGNGVTTNGTLQIGGASPTVGEDLNITLTSATLAINEKVAFDIFGGKGSGVANGATDADRLLLTGSTSGIVALGAGASLVVNTASNTGWTAGSAWQLFDWASIAPTGAFSNLTSTQGNFTDLPDLSLFDLAWDVSNIYTAGTISIVVVPEPSRLMLLMFGLLGLVFRRRRHD